MYHLKTEIEKRFIEAAHRVSNNMLYKPEIAVIAGSGIYNAMKDLEIIQKIEYSETGILPDTSVDGHKSEILIARNKDIPIIVFAGRYHIYEGYSPLVTAYPVILAYALGVKNIIITNSAGGVNINFKLGQIMLIDDVQVLTQQRYYHNYSIDAIIKNYHNSFLIDRDWMKRISKLMIEKKVDFKNGIYSQVTGPNYETRAEIRMLRKFGADAVGMSTGIEVNFASMLGLKCVACSLITNKAYEVDAKEITHGEVLYEAERASNQMKHFITGAIETIEKKI